METVLTAILVSVILNTATGGRSIGHNAAIAVGSTVALLGLFASPISGASMNPARTLGPDIVGNDYTGWWVYVAGPVLGAAIAVAIIGLVRDCRTRRSVKQPRAAPCRSLAPSPRPRTATEKAGRRRQLPTGIGDEHVGARSGAFGPEIIAQPRTGWAMILFMPGLRPPGAPGCSPSTTRPGIYGGADRAILRVLSRRRPTLSEPPSVCPIHSGPEQRWKICWRASRQRPPAYWSQH
jgi:hypothetical protein